MPDSPKILLIVIAVFEVAVGLLMVSAPARFLAKALPGVVPGIDGITSARLAGTALISLAALAWLGRDVTDPTALQPILGALLLYNIFAVVNLFYQGAKISSGAFGPGIVHLILTIALFYYWRQIA